MSEDINYTWDLVNTVWEKSLKYTMTFASNGSMLEQASYTWVSTDNLWQGLYKMKYFYDNIASIGKKSKNAISLYPNPAKNTLYINNIQNANVTVFDLSGKLLINLQNTDSQIDISSLSEGIYIINVTTNQGTSVTKFVKE